ncbi:uncharacterized protein LOC114018570 [Chelonia mydas]|uniref:uncharacterized protein LOC114018570 n=1 Tax=Chelonia mydas TaxID=8469 RepID=UPI0018A1E1F9|nr:uncharacterized protein LOC114018570 [Chelonia mydas]
MKSLRDTKGPATMHILQGVPQPQPAATLLRPLTVLSSLSHVTSNYGHIRGIVTTELKEEISCLFVNSPNSWNHVIVKISAFIKKKRSVTSPQGCRQKFENVKPKDSKTRRSSANILL